MSRLIWAASVRAHAILRYAPTNLLIAAIRTRRGLRWGLPAMLLTVPYWFVASWCVTTIENGGPRWLNALVLLAAWNMMKFVLMGPVSLTLLATARLRERSARRHGDVDPRLQETTHSRTQSSGATNSRKDRMSVAPTRLGPWPGGREVHRRGPQRADTVVDTLGHDHEVIEYPKEPRQ